MIGPLPAGSCRAEKNGQRIISSATYDLERKMWMKRREAE
jgi:hypothetical protein